MKKFFNLILAALVIIGAAACAKNDEIVDKTEQGESLSFYANVVNDVTRAHIDNADGDKIWNTIWDEGDNVYVSLSGEAPFTFTYDGEKFTCSEPGVTSLIGETVTVGPCNVNDDSTAGKNAWSFTGTKVEKFDNNATVNLTADTSFFRYTYNGTGDVTITVTPKEGDTKVFRYCVKEDVFDYYPSITFKGAAEDKFVGFWPQTLSGLEATLSYSINGVVCKETSITLVTGKVYNLGTLEAKKNEVFLVPGVWTSDGARFAVYEIDTETWTSMTAVEGQIGTYTAKVATSNIILTRMNPANEVNNWDNKWNQTADLVVPTDNKNCYYITGWGTDKSVGEWHEVGYVPPVPSITWALAGDFNSWGDLVMQSTDTANIFVAKGVELATGSEIKVKDLASWDTSFGRGVTYLAANSYMTVIQGSSDNITIAQSGTYDVYFEYLGANSHLYLMKANADYKTAKEQTADGAPVPDQPQGETPDQASAWSLSGTLNNWGDTQMVTTTVKNLFVAKNVKLSAYGAFKVRKDKAWTESYGGGIKYMNASAYIKVYSSGSDIYNTTSGTFDIYFDYTNKYLYLVIAGDDYTSVKMQTSEGSAPSPANVSFGLVGAHNNWGGSKDTVLTLDTSINAYVAKSAKLTGEFKIRGDNTWGAYNYGAASSGSVTVGKAISVKNNSQTNLKVTSGTYDVYFSYGKNKVWVMPVGQVPTDL